jgi:hypothetical protein
MIRTGTAYLLTDPGTPVAHGVELVPAPQSRSGHYLRFAGGVEPAIETRVDDLLLRGLTATSLDQRRAIRNRRHNRLQLLLVTDDGNELVVGIGARDLDMSRPAIEHACFPCVVDDRRSAVV